MLDAGDRTGRGEGVSWPRVLVVFVLLAATTWLMGRAAPNVQGQQATATATPVQRPGGRFEETDPLLLYSGTWVALSDPRASGGTLRWANTAGSTVQLTFPGPNVRWVTAKGPTRGVARVLIDGAEAQPGRIDLYSPTEQFQVEFSWGGLAGDQMHTIRIEVTGERSGAATQSMVDVDAFIVEGATSPATPTPPVQRPGGRFQESDPLLLFGGAWTAINDGRASGGAFSRATTPGASIQLTFPGPNVRWVTTKGPDRGIARVFLDGTDRGTIDLYAPTEQFQQESSWGGLAGDQSHTIRIEVTGQRSGAATGTNVDVDAFIVEGATAPEPLRFEDSDPALLYSGNWAAVSDSRAGGGAVRRSNQPAAGAQFTFAGTSVTWITSRGPNRGVARVLINGVDRERPDLFSGEEAFQQEFRYEGLAEGIHTIRVEVTGTRSGAASDSFVDVDAFLAFGALTTPVPTPTLLPTATPTATAPAAPTATAIPTATAVPTPTATVPPAPRGPRDSRFFFETSFRVDSDAFWDFFQDMGGVDTFGFPVSRTFMFLGCTTQFFQRQLLQQCGPEAPVQTMNLLDPDLMPYNQINFSTFPPYDGDLAAIAPAPGSPAYGRAVLAHVQRAAPDTFDGLPVRFFATFVNTVPGSDPASDPDFAALINLQIWGFPTSRPAFDPTNRGFVYQRFQRGILHFDATTGATRGILLADWFSSIITGQGLPPDLGAQAARSRFLRQYCPGAPQWLCRPVELLGTDLTFAFEPQ